MFTVFTGLLKTFLPNENAPRENFYVLTPFSFVLKRGDLRVFHDSTVFV